jgi:hypothetical protein
LQDKGRRRPYRCRPIEFDLSSILWLRRRAPTVHVVEGLLLVGLEKSDIPAGSSIEIKIDGKASIV